MFYEAINEERKKELNEEVVRKKRLYNASEMSKKSLEQIEDRFNIEFGEFMQKYLP